ncbi:MAG TPA: TonB-dependent receptor [Woeseiaceae bacterium]|nr:TonB-dependent receptor [Woeseiaceae bacterium]
MIQLLTSRLRVTVAGIALLGALTPGAALAQQDGSRQVALEEIIVTARRFEESLQEAPVSVTAFTAADLERRGYTNVSQIADVTPNMQFDATAPISGASNASSIFIRGIGQTDFLLTVDPGVGIYLDGVYISRSVGGVLGLLDLERVEVLRGPQGTLFGRNTIGGAINMTTRKPDGEFAGYAELSVGRYDRLDARLSVNAPIVEDKLFARLSASSRNRDGYGRRLLTGESMGNENSDAARAAVRWLATDALEVDFAADYTRAREESPVTTLVWERPLSGYGVGAITGLYNLLVAPGTGVPYDSRFLTGDPYTSNATGPTGSELDVWGLAMTVDWDAGPFQVKSITAYRDMESVFGRDPDGSPLTIVHTDNVMAHEQFSQELHFTGTAANDRLDWLAGLYYFDESGFDDVTADIGAGIFEAIGVPLSIAGPTYVDNKSYAAFLNLGYAFTERLSGSAGIRYSRDEKRAVINQVFPDLGSVPVLANPVGEESFDDVTPKVSLEYRWTDDVMTYASFARGFKSGGFTGRYVIPTAAPRPFDPEEVTTWELGFKSEFLDSRVRLNGAGFYSDYQDIQVVIFNGVAPETRNAAKGRIRGGEIELTAVPVPDLLFTGGLGYLDAEYTGFDPLDSIGLVLPLELSDKFVNTPEWSLNAAVDYTIPLGNAAGDMSLRGDWSYRSAVANDAINTPELIQDGYSLVNARITYTAPGETWELSVFGTNLTDERYITSGVADVPSFGLVEATWARPREWGATVKYNF